MASSPSPQVAFKSIGKRSTGDMSPSAKPFSNTQSRRRTDIPRSSSNLRSRPLRDPSPSSAELIKKVAELEQERRKQEAVKNKEARERQKELMAAKKRITKETRATQQAVRKSEQEMGKLAQQVARVDHASELERTKQMRQLQRLEETIKKLQTNRNALAETLQNKMAAVGEARGKLKHLEVTASLLDVGVFASPNNPIKKGVDIEVQCSPNSLPETDASVAQDTSTETQECRSDTTSHHQDLPTSGSEVSVKIDIIATIVNPADQPTTPNSDHQSSADNVARENLAHVNSVQLTTPSSSKDMTDYAKSLNSCSLMCDSHEASAGTKDESSSNSEVSPPLWCRIQNAAYRRTTENCSSPFRSHKYEHIIEKSGRITSAPSSCRQQVRQASVGISRRTPSLTEPTGTSGELLRSASAVSARQPTPFNSLTMPFPAWTYQGVRLQNWLQNSPVANTHQLRQHGLDAFLAQSPGSSPTGVQAAPSMHLFEPIAAPAPTGTLKLHS